MICIAILLILCFVSLLRDMPYMTIGCLISIGGYLLINGWGDDNMMKKMEHHPKESTENVLRIEKEMVADSIWNTMTEDEKVKTIKLYNEFVKE